MWFCHNQWLMVTVRDVSSVAILLQHQPYSQMPVVMQAYANYNMGPPQVRYSLSEFSLPHWLFILVFVMMLLSTFIFWCGRHFHQWDLNQLGLHHCNPLEFTLGRHMYLLVLVPGPCHRWTEYLLPHCFEHGTAQCYSNICHPTIQSL